VRSRYKRANPAPDALKPELEKKTDQSLPRERR
jgi:hypothetical protein